MAMPHVSPARLRALGPRGMPPVRAPEAFRPLGPDSRSDRTGAMRRTSAPDTSIAPRDRLLDVHEAAAFLAVKPATLYQWAYQRRIPAVDCAAVNRFTMPYPG